MTSFDIPETSGIYLIRCIPTQKFYLGSTSNLRRRWQDHRKELRGNRHGNPKLQHAWNKYGEQAFVYEVLELVLPAFQLEREQYWLDKLKPWGKNGMNIARSAQAFGLGLTRSPEARAKMSAAKRGKPSTRIGYTPSESTREKIRQANLGKKMSDATRAKMSASRTGVKQSPRSAQACANISAAKKGKPRHLPPDYTVSDETREKLRLANLGKKQSEETKEKQRLANLGREVSESTREKLRAKMSDAKSASKKTLIAISPDGETYLVHGIGAFCREHHLHPAALMEVATGKRPHTQGWTARLPNNDNELRST